ncbi:MAG: 3-hydroxyacyl-CoA dehydrogenase family protein [Smithellaceae bacterium]|jgi:3-hydroxybutyryl-CoA dehydrogenase|nr:3-hydroxyacyl-CoA dehydrogenase family protein [Smithellaceae bacterium]MDD3534300.1 3-hydroxyacyl-CoA dehydrogenase family protein [Candidatus Cloacimonadota bacterium]
MKIEDVKNICVVGAGNMGHQISLHCALKGYKVVCTDVIPAVLEKAEKFVESYLAGRVQKGKLTEEAANNARANISFIGDLKTAAGNADLVIEAVLERIDLKRKIFADLDKIAPVRAILATNSSYIVSSEIAGATNRPEKVANLHFFNPALVMKLVEVVQGPHVSDETAQILMEFCRKIEKEPIHIKKEVYGFVLNRIFAAIFREAEWMLEMGVASFEDIDRACLFGAGHPMGPFQLMDLTGIDLAYDIAMGKFRETGNLSNLPIPTIVKLYTEGKYGQKAGEGFYSYKK